MCSKKNRHLLRRLTVLLPLFATCFVLLVNLSSCDREELIINRWNLQEVLKNDEPYEDSTQYHLIPSVTLYYFYYVNSLNVRSIYSPSGTYDGHYHFVNPSTIFMRFTIKNQRNEFTAKIKKLTQRQLHIEYEDKGDIYYLKLYSD